VQLIRKLGGQVDGAAFAVELSFPERPFEAARVDVFSSFNTTNECFLDWLNLGGAKKHLSLEVGDG